MLDKKAYLKAARHHARGAGVSLLSAQSPHSIMRFLSVGSILSAGSILSIGGVGSVLMHPQHRQHGFDPEHR